MVFVESVTVCISLCIERVEKICVQENSKGLLTLQLVVFK
jgi:hypothetical protein